MSNEPLVSISFNGGYTARQMFSFLQQLVGSFPIFCYEDRIEIEHSIIIDKNTMKLNVGFVKFDMEYILDYKINMDKCNDPANKRYILNPKVTEMLNYINTTGKKDSFIINYYESSPSDIIVNIIKAGSRMEGEGKVSLVPYEPIDVIVNNSIFSSSIPNVKILLSDLSQICSNISKIRSRNVNINISSFDSGVLIYAGDHTKPMSIRHSRGNIESNNMISNHPISVETNKAFTNIGNITNDGIVPFYFAPSLMMMKIRVGCYATISIHFYNGIQEKLTDNDLKEDNTSEQNSEEFDVDLTEELDAYA